MAFGSKLVYHPQEPHYCASAITELEDFTSHAAAILNDSNDHFWDCRDLLTSLARSRAVLEYVESELHRALATPHYFPRLVLHECSRFTLLLRMIRARPPLLTIASAVEHRMISLLDGAAEVSHFLQPEPHPVDVFDPERKLVSLGLFSLNAGEVMQFRAAADCCELCTNTHAVLLEMRSGPLYQFQWLYDIHTLAPKRFLFTNSADMRSDLALRVARYLESPDSVAHIKPFLTHPNYLIRSSALNALVALDEKNTGEYLALASQDAHPAIRNSLANRALHAIADLVDPKWH